MVFWTKSSNEICYVWHGWGGVLDEINELDMLLDFLTKSLNDICHFWNGSGGVIDELIEWDVTFEMTGVEF